MNDASIVVAPLAIRIQVPIDGHETHRRVRAGTRHDHPRTVCWRTGSGQGPTSSRCSSRDQRTRGWAANLPGTNSRHSLHHSAAESQVTRRSMDVPGVSGRAAAIVKTATEERRRSLFKVPVFRGRFETRREPSTYRCALLFPARRRSRLEPGRDRGRGQRRTGSVVGCHVHG